MSFYLPNNLPELAQCLSRKSGADSHLLAGCTDFLAKRNGKAWDADVLISLNNVPELQEVRLEGNVLSIGAACTHTHTEEHPLVRQYFPALAQACGNVGSKQVRNRGTLGGSIGNASPAGDIYPVLLALDAQAVLMNSKGEFRRLPMAEVLLGIGKTALAEDEVITAFELPLPPAGNLNAFVKLGERKRVTIAKINMAASLELHDGVMRNVRVTLGAVAAKAFFARSAEAVLEGKVLSSGLFPTLSAALTAEIEASIPGRSSLPYKRRAVRGLADDLLTELIRQTERQADIQKGKNGLHT